MTRLKRETDLLYGEALYCLASPSAIFFFFCWAFPTALRAWRVFIAQLRFISVFKLFNLQVQYVQTWGVDGRRSHAASVLKFEPNGTRWIKETPGLKEVSVEHFFLLKTSQRPVLQILVSVGCIYKQFFSQDASRMFLKTLEGLLRHR